MPVMVQINLANDKTHRFGDDDEAYLVAGFNKVYRTKCDPLDRPHRHRLLALTDELNARTGKAYDLLDVLQAMYRLEHVGRFIPNEDPEYEDEIPDNVELGGD